MAIRVCERDHSSMKKSKKSPANPRVHVSREDRARTASGKTVNSKVRSEGRALAAQARSASTKDDYLASRTKVRD